MSHVALVRPPAVATLHAYSVGVVPPLGLAYVAAALERAGHRVTVVDALGEAPTARHPAAHPQLAAFGLSIDEIVRRIPDGVAAIGLSVMFSQSWPHVAALCTALRARFPDVPIFLGGEHVTGTWEHVLSTCPAVTLCVLGEGEAGAVDVIAHAEGRLPLERIPGIAYRRDGRPVRSPARPRIRAVDTLPRPAWHLFPLENYLSAGYGHGVDRGRSIPMLATRGCPYQCTFCSSPAMWTTRYYKRSVREVVDELEDYVRLYRITNVDFEDLTAIIDRQWILDFCAELKARGLRVTFQLPSGTRSEALDEEVLRALAENGCRNITYAPESGSPRILKLIKKRVKLPRLFESMTAAKRVGINVKANLMIGFPDETRADLARTLWFGLRAAWAGVDDIPLFPFSPYPGTELYERLRAEGRVPPQSADYFASLGYMDLGAPVSYSAHLSALELQVVRLVGMSAFYATNFARRPWRIPALVRNVLTGRNETVLEQRLVEVWKRRRPPPAPTPPTAPSPPTPAPAPDRRASSVSGRRLPVLPTR